MKNLFARYSFSLLIVLTLLATSCRVARPIKAGQKIAIQPCSLVETGKIEKVLGGPLTPPALLLTLEQTRQGKRSDSAYCRYEKKGAEGNGEYFEISIKPETKSELGMSGEKVTGLGRDAVLRSEDRHGLGLYVLSVEGAFLYMALSVAGRDQKELIQDIKPLAKDALSATKTKFPGKDEMKPTPAPVDICSLVSGEEVARLKGDASDDFKGEWFDGPTGGRWECWYLREEIVIVHMPKNPEAYEDLVSAGAQQVKGLGSKAYWKPLVREPSYIPGQLFVVLKNGKSFGVDIDGFDAEDQVLKNLAVEVAKVILTKI